MFRALGCLVVSAMAPAVTALDANSHPTPFALSAGRRPESKGRGTAPDGHVDAAALVSLQVRRDPAFEAVLAEIAGVAREDAAVAADQQRVRQHAVAVAEFARQVAELRVIDEDRV